MSSSVHANNKNKDILMFGKGQTQELDNATLREDAEYWIDFSSSARNIFFKSSL